VAKARSIIVAREKFWGWKDGVQQEALDSVENNKPSKRPL